MRGNALTNYWRVAMRKGIGHGYKYWNVSISLNRTSRIQGTWCNSVEKAQSAADVVIVSDER